MKRIIKDFTSSAKIMCKAAGCLQPFGVEMTQRDCRGPHIALQRAAGRRPNSVQIVKANTPTLLLS